MVSLKINRFLLLLIVVVSINSCKKKVPEICSSDPDCSSINLVDVKAISAVLNENNVDLTACIELCIDSLENRGIVISTSHISENSNYITSGYSMNYPGSSLYVGVDDLSNTNVNSGEFTMTFSSLSNSTTFYYRAFTKYKESNSNNISDYRVSEEKEFTTN